MSIRNERFLLDSLGGEAGCRRLASEFYGRVAKDPVLRPLFPGKSLRCATEEFAAFLIQFLDGDPTQTQYRWWLSLRESHARFHISEAQRAAWVSLMHASIRSLFADDEMRKIWEEFFLFASFYVIGDSQGEIGHQELAWRWRQQLSLDQAFACLSRGADDEAIAFASEHVARPSVLVGILARMMATGRPLLIEFVLENLEGVAEASFNGRTLLHHSSGSGCLPVVERLLAMGLDPNGIDSGGHTPLYRVANGCGLEAGGDVVRALVAAGARVDHSGGSTRSTALHAAARHGHMAAAQALLEAGASLDALDSKGFSPLDRARNCRREEVARALIEWEAKGRSHV